MSDTIGNAQIVLSANTARFEQGMARAKDTANDTFSSMKTGAMNAGTAIAAGLAMATVALGEMIKSQVEAADEMSKFANQAGVSVQKMQELSAGAKMLGLETDDLNDVFEDLNDKIGEFTAENSGELKDLFEKLPSNVNLTAESFRKLSGPDALQAYYNALEKANLTSTEMIHYMEEFASDSSKLIPMLKNNGEGFKMMAEAAENAGAVMDKKTIRASQEMKVASDLMGLSLKGVQNQMTQGLIPVLSDLAGMLVKDAKLKETAKTAGDGLAVGFKYLVATGVGVVGIISTIGTAIGGLISALAQWGTVADGVDFSSPFAFFQIGKNVLNVPVKQFEALSGAYQKAKADLIDYDTTIGKLVHLGENGTNSTVAKLTDIKYGDQNGVKATVGKAKIKGDDNGDDDDDEDGSKKGKKAGNLLKGEIAKAILWGASQLKINPNDLAAVISFETGGTFSPAAKNPGSSGTGLIQFMSDKYTSYGFNRNQFAALSASEQMKYVVKYLSERHIGQGSGVGDIYDAVSGYGYKRGTKAYAQNRVWDVNGNGVIEKGEAVKGSRFKQHMKNYFPNGMNQQDIGEMQSSMAKDAVSQEQAQAQIEKSFADQSAKRLIEYKAKIEEIKKAYGENDPKRAEYLKKAEEEYDRDIASYKLAQDQKLAKYTDFKKSEKEKLVESAIFEAQTIKLDKTMGEDLKKQTIDNLSEQLNHKLNIIDLASDKERYNNDKEHLTTLDRITIESNFKRREIDLNYEYDQKTKSLKKQMVDENEETLKQNAMQAYEDELEQITGIGKSELQKITDDYEKKRRILDKREDIDDGQKSTLRNALAGGEIRTKRGIKDQIAEPFNDLQTKYNQTNQYPELEKQYKTKYEIIAKYEKLGVEEARKAQVLRTNLERQYGEERFTIAVTQGGQIFGSVTGMLKSTLGEHNKFYIGAMALEKSANIFRSMLAIKTGISLALANPFPMNLGAMVSVATAGASIISDLMSLRQPALSGQAHDGIDYIPKEGTWLLDGGERIVKPADNRKLSDFLDNQDGQTGNKNPVNVNIHNHAGVPVTQKRDSNGDLRLIIGDELAKQLPHHVNNPSSDFNQSMKRNYHIQRKFG